MTTKVFVPAQLPAHWIVFWDEQWWLVPARSNGWEGRKRIYPQPAYIRAYKPATRNQARGVGIPDWPYREIA